MIDIAHQRTGGKLELFLKKGSKGSEIKYFQKLLVERGYIVKIDGIFGNKTYKAVRLFQAQNLDQHGQPLFVDGIVGPLTLWSMTHPKQLIQSSNAVDFSKMPPAEKGGSPIGRAALKAAIDEIQSGAREIGGNNRGKWVKKYLSPTGLDEGFAWCAAFASWCYLSACGGIMDKMPFPYTARSRSLLKFMKEKGWASGPKCGFEPKSGDLVFWWREKMDGGLGHVGLVHQQKNGMLYTIEGNKSPHVQGFSYIMSRMDRLLGFGRVPGGN